ncbi:peptidylprolyl isomerase [Singulisphaera sp. PoT]|uniref:peptidylprolyl isomerase n=1 Tax=Singulisphaera sp. PoT TaxID=3411797 RepID=UPI003BF5F661
MLITLAALGLLEAGEASADLLPRRNKAAAAKPKQEQAASEDQAPPASFSQKDIKENGTGQIKLVPQALPVNPTDPIAVVNGEVISRMQLADECVARKGEEILETLIARKLIEQALKKNNYEVTAAEIDQEINNVAQSVGGVNRENWLRTLEKERGISPVQYARDIIYPALALRKLASKRVQVTPKDLQESFEAAYGDKLRCRVIMLDKLATAQSVWEEVRKNPGGFEKIAQDRSIDTGSRSLGGLLAEPISRHAYPRTVSEAAFRELVDGDPSDKDVSHKPKDGDFTGPIQVAESTWIILRREGIIPAQKVDAKDERVRKSTYDMIYEVKLKEAMNSYMVDLMKASAIDNKLTGHTKLANENEQHDALADSDVQLMSNPAGTLPESGKSQSPTPPPTRSARMSAPAAASPDVVKQVESLKRGSSSK